MRMRSRPTETPPAELSARDRALEFIRRTTELIADEVRPVEAGFVVRTPSLPMVWGLNHLRLIVPVSTEEALALADEHLAELPYIQLHVEDEPSGRELERSLRAAGWKTEREVLMAFRRGPDREIDTDVVIEVDQNQTLELMRRWILEGPPGVTPEALPQLVEYARREGRARQDRNFGVIGDVGSVVAMTKLRSDGATTQLEDVYTAPEERGRGHARALLTRAVAEARRQAPDTIFIVADDNDWPKRLYRRIGFEPIGWTWSFHQVRRRQGPLG
jgi:ribosomal protein S18 acetylase RimI-like enzyme